MFITTIDEIINFFPPGSVDVEDGELHSPCPLCTGGGSRHVQHGISFWGEDRLIWYADRAGVHCRKCGQYASMQHLVNLLSPGSEVSPALAPTEIVKEITEPVIASDAYVNKLHSKADRGYWSAFGWSDDTINRFKVGKGRMYEFGSFQADRHVIPFHPQRVDRVYEGWSFEGRLPKGDKSGEAPNIKTKGLKGGGWFWFINDDPSGTLVAITEGLKDAATAWQLGYRNVLAIFGTSAWDVSFARFLSEQGFETAHVFGDNDDAGRSFNEAMGLDLHAAGVKPYYLAWTDAYGDKSDLTDVLSQSGQEKTLRYIEENLKLSGQTRGRVKDYRTVDPLYQPPSTINALPLEQIRDDLPSILADFKNTYKLRKKIAKRGVVKILAAPPGSGKSYSLMNFAQDEARKVMEEFAAQLEQAQEALEQSKEALANATNLDEQVQAQGFVDRIGKGIANASKAKILFAAPFINGWDDLLSQPGFDPDLWYNFQARNPDNCENNDIAAQLGAKGYAVAKFCETQCPFAQKCKQFGYLKQERERKQKPITFVRHANLVSDSLLVGYQIIIIDENFLDVFAEFSTLNDVDKLVPSRSSWADYQDSNFQQTEWVNNFLEAVRKTLVSNMGKGEEGLLSGLTYMQEVEKNLGSSLAELLRKIDPAVIKAYQPIAPPAFTEVAQLPPRIVELLFQAMKEEISDFTRGEMYNSRIHQLDGELSVSNLFPLHISANKPIIVADGTAFPELYGYLFNRTVEVYQPELFNPEAQIEQLTGSDFSRTMLRQQMGKYAYDRLDVIPDEALEIADILGETVSFEDIPVTDDMFGSPALQQAFEVLLEVASNPAHEKILFVTYKNFRVALERRLKDLTLKGKKKEYYVNVLNKMAFGHYGGLRGTNRFKDFDAVVLLGCPRQPYRQMHMRIQAWARLAGKADYIPYNVVAKPAPYHGVEMYEGFTYYTFEDAFADRFVQMYEEGEIRQCLDRIRIYSGGRKHAYLLIGRPAAKWVTTVTSGRKIARRAYKERNEDVLGYIERTEATFYKLPSVASVANEHGLSRSAAQQALKVYQETKKGLLSISQ